MRVPLLLHCCLYQQLFLNLFSRMIDLGVSKREPIKTHQLRDSSQFMRLLHHNYSKVFESNLQTSIEVKYGCLAKAFRV